MNYNSIKQNGLSNIDIQGLCKKLKIKLNEICMKDELRIEDMYNGGYIINLANHNQSGTHWVCFQKIDNTIYYCDSYGVVAPQNQVDLFANLSYKLYYNKVQVQDFSSNFCGLFCVLFLYIIQNNLNNPTEACKLFVKVFNTNKKDLKLNDEILYDYIKALLE